MSTNRKISDAVRIDLNHYKIFNDKYDKMVEAWSEPHRVYHDIDHLTFILSLIDADTSLTDVERRKLRVIACYHDYYYNPYRKDNEERSAQQFLNDAVDFTNEDEKFEIYFAITDTADHTQKLSSEISQKFILYDLHNLIYGNLSDTIEDGLKIMREYGFADWTQIKAGRIAVIEKYVNLCRTVNYLTPIHGYLRYLYTWEPKIAIYPGTFYPFHKGHDDILKKAERIFDKVIIAPGINPEKKDNFARLNYLTTKLPGLLPHNQIETFPGLLTDYIKSKPYPVTVVKGLRNTDDFKAEEVQLRYIEDLDPTVNVCYLMSDRNTKHISSSAIKMVEAFDKEQAKVYSL